jgi:hypothetical protein
MERSRSADTFQLPDGWSTPEIVEDVIVADEVPIHRAGLATVGSDGEEVCGSAADVETSALPRAQFELLERVSAMEAFRSGGASYAAMNDSGAVVGEWTRAEVFPESDEPQRWRYARTNGVALHRDWATACLRAFYELAERDRVLRSWYGEITPRRRAFDPAETPLGRTKSYAWQAYAFPEPYEGGFSRGVEVVGVFGFPSRDDLPFLLGLGARHDPREALDAACREALQVLAFLWGEEQPPVDIPLGPTAMHHLDAFQVPGRHAVVRRWLEGAHARHFRGRRPTCDCSRVAFVDLTPPWLDGGLRVAKAVCKQAMPLVFGDSPFAAHLPEDLRVHPIA